MLLYFTPCGFSQAASGSYEVPNAEISVLKGREEVSRVRLSTSVTLLGRDREPYASCGILYTRCFMLYALCSTLYTRTRPPQVYMWYTTRSSRAMRLSEEAVSMKCKSVQ